MNTTTIINGLTVLAKPDNSPLTYGNLTAAQKKADSLSSLTESWEGRKVEGYRFCVVRLAQEAHGELMAEAHAAYRNPAYDGPDGIFADFMSDEVTDTLDAARDPAHFLEPEDADENYPDSITDLYSTARTTAGGLSKITRAFRQAAREIRVFLERERDRRLFWEASQIIESLRGIHSMDVIRFSPRSGSSAGKYTMRLAPGFGIHKNIQYPISREHVSLLVRAGFLRPGKRNRWKFVPEKLNRSLRYLGAR